MLDGKPFQYVSGSFHYFRTPRAYWRDRLRKIRAAGLNAISTYYSLYFYSYNSFNYIIINYILLYYTYNYVVYRYVEWSLHQPRPNTWEWTGEADIVTFLTMAQEEDLFVLLRPGPYICAERDLVINSSLLLSFAWQNTNN